jgi:hypothetical protein
VSIDWPLGRVVSTEEYMELTGGDAPLPLPAMVYGVPEQTKTATEKAMEGVDQPAHYARRKMQAIEYKWHTKWR